MRNLERSSAFRRDYKRILAHPFYRKEVDLLLLPVLDCLSAEEILPSRYRDHPLTGNWAGYRECHLKPDLLLIYRLVGSDILRLARLGTHSELFG